MAKPLATLGILSVGDMGVGVARLLTAHNYRVLTNASDRSKATQERATANGVTLISDDVELCNLSDYILSIVPQRDALSVAKRIVAAANNGSFAKRETPLYFLDVNAVSPNFARATDELFATSAPDVRLIDGGIIGGPPSLKEDGTWSRPSFVVSGPNDLRKADPSGEHLAQVLNVRHVNDTIGSASGLKMCFAAMSKGFTALAIQSFTTAHNLGVVPELQDHLKNYNPLLGQVANKTLTTMPPKAYRWVREMDEIAETFEQEGGFSREESIFRPISEIYSLVTDGTELGREKTEDRQRGQSAEDVALLMSEGLEKRKLKTD